MGLQMVRAEGPRKPPTLHHPTTSFLMASLLRSLLRRPAAAAAAGRFSPLPIPHRWISPFRSPAIPFSPWRILASHFNSSTFGALTDTRFPKRRPGLAPRKKRAKLRPKGPFAWIESVPGEPVPTSQPNEGSIKAKRRKEKKRIQQRLEFIAGEVKKRKAAFAEHKRKKGIERIERKMAAVAREKAWAERLIELQQLEEAKKAAHAT